ETVSSAHGSAVAVNGDLSGGGNDREVAVTNVELREGRADAALPHWPFDLLQAFVGAQRGGHRAGEELLRLYATRAACRSPLEARPEHLRDQRQLGAGISVCEAAADRAAIARLHMTDPSERLAQQRHTRRERIIALDHALADAGADPHLVGFQ